MQRDLQPMMRVGRRDEAVAVKWVPREVPPESDRGSEESASPTLRAIR